MSRDFIIIGTMNGLSRDIARNMLLSHGLREVSRADALARKRERGKPIFFIYLSTIDGVHQDRAMYEVPCVLKADLVRESYDSIGDKWTLTRSLPQWCARSWMLNDFAQLYCARDSRAASSSAASSSAASDAIPDHLIMRPIGKGCFGGYGIIRADFTGLTREQRCARITKLIREYRDIRVFRHGVVARVMVSQYEMNALLFDSRKFHLRAYMMIKVKHGKTLEERNFRWSLFGADLESADWRITNPRAKILTAADVWSRDEPMDNARVHDSHAKSTPGAYFFPTHYARITHQPLRGCARCAPLREDDVITIIKHMNTMCADLARVIGNDVQAFPESRAGFLVLGLDVMIRDDLTPLLIEVNDRVGYSTQDHTREWDQLQREYFDWVWNLAIAPLIEEPN